MQDIHAIPVSATSAAGLHVLTFDAATEVIDRLGDTAATHRIGGLDITTGYIRDAHRNTRIVLVSDQITGCAVVSKWEPVAVAPSPHGDECASEFGEFWP